ncbi:MAG: dihydropteroate synthase [Planctomycetota bacterium]
MSDWSGDPVFGDLALRLRPRVLLTLQNEPGSGPSAEATTWTYSAFCRERLTRDEAASLVGHDGLFYRDVHRDGRAETHLHALVHSLRACARDQPLLALLLAAHDARSRPSGDPRLMGIVNVTPDSFSDGGSFIDPARAIEHGLQLVADGAKLLDVGGESTRPGSQPVDEDEELRRVLPVVRGLVERARVPVSIDTTKASVARACLDAGATIVNDVSGGRFDSQMLTVVARARAGYVVMHMLGTPRDMQFEPHYVDVVGEVLEFLRERCRAALEAGIDRAQLCIDPGIGFGKLLEHNVALLRSLSTLRALGLPILLGVSRKSFIATIEDRADAPRSSAAQRLGGTLAALTVGVQAGAEILRVHDVREARQAALVAHALARRDGVDASA